MVAYGARVVVGVTIAIDMRVRATCFGGARFYGATVVVVAIRRFTEATRAFGADPWMA